MTLLEDVQRAMDERRVFEVEQSVGALAEANIGALGLSRDEHQQCLFDMAQWLEEHDAAGTDANYRRLIRLVNEDKDSDRLLLADIYLSHALYLISKDHYERAAEALAASLNASLEVHDTHHELVRQRIEEMQTLYEKIGHAEGVRRCVELLRSPGDERTRRSDLPRLQSTLDEEVIERTVHFCTHRRKRQHRPSYQNYFGEVGAAEMSLGVASVLIPKYRHPGRRPDLAGGSKLSWDPRKYVVLDTIRLEARRENYVSALGDSVNASQGKEILVYIHGIGTTFAASVQEAALLAQDLDVSGAVIAYTWPSQGKWTKYQKDRGTIRQRFAEDVYGLLADILGRTPAARLTFVAHSLGCEFLVRLLEEFRDKWESGEAKRCLRNAIFASPAVPATDFADRVKKVRQLVGRASVYVSRRDLPIRVAEILYHGNTELAGASPEIVAAAGVDCIDTTQVPRQFRPIRTAAGHDDYLAAMDDIRATIWFDLAPSQRRSWLRAASTSQPSHWIMQWPRELHPRKSYVRDALEAARKEGSLAHALQFACRMRDTAGHRQGDRSETEHWGRVENLLKEFMPSRPA